MKKLFLLFALCAFTLAACETATTSEEAPKGKLTLTSKSVMNFEIAGGAGEITYAFVEEETRANKVTAITVVDWITDVTVGNNKITFNVAANEGKERSATIKVEYGQDSFQVMIEQDGLVLPDVTFNATHLGGGYYGKLQTRGFNYSVILSDMRPEHPTSKPAGATEYRFDIYSSVSSAFNKQHKVPVGTYKFDRAKSGEPGTINGDADWTYLFDAYDTMTPYRDATLVVTEESIIADVTFSDGTYHRVEYYGSNEYEDYTELTYADVYPVSQHTSDINFNVTDGEISAFYRADWFGIGMDNWFLYMLEDKSKSTRVYLQIDLIVPKSSTGGYDNCNEAIVGEYSIFSEKPSNYSYTIPAGHFRDDSIQIGGWYATCVGAEIDLSTAAPFCGGTVKVENTGGSDYKITVDSYDDRGNKIQGTFEAVLGYVYDQNCD